MPNHTSYGCFFQVPYEDIEAHPAHYYDVSKYKAFIKNPLLPDVGIMALASIAFTLASGNFNFYDPDTIQANILSHAHMILQHADSSDGAEGQDGLDESGTSGNGEGVAEDLTSGIDRMKLSGPEAEEELEGKGEVEEDEDKNMVSTEEKVEGEEE
jgi:hypothetical protein